jgi:carbamoyl-phosphate synthase large subunit
MPKRNDIKKVLMIGSGPIIIGQAAEFDYAGTQACRTLKQENIEVILINSNPATIMTDKDVADKVYIEPLNAEFIKKIILKEKPDSLLPTLGGQTGLNLAMDLYETGFLSEHNVEMLGTKAEAIRMAEDRLAFKNTMESIGEPCVPSRVVSSVEDALCFANEIGYPVIIRPAYTLGGSGGGIVSSDGELDEVCRNGLRQSRVSQVLVEKSIAGWKEIEYEVMRDAKGNVITVCNMENLDPVGIHTGDSIVVAPSQTLSDKEYQMLRTASLNIITALKIEGGCNVQLALDPYGFDYKVIEVNPRVSRSSALASKATGYPIAKVATKIAIGYSLDEIENAVTQKTYACFEPALDYVVVKIPKWPFDKFVKAKKTLGTQMKATGEVMAIDNSFEAALLKAVRSLELNHFTLTQNAYRSMTDREVSEKIAGCDDERLFIIAEALRRGIRPEDINKKTMIDLWFLYKIKDMVDFEQSLRNNGKKYLDDTILKKAKRMGYTDRTIANLTGCAHETVRNMRKAAGINIGYKMVDTCAAEFDAKTPYYYSTYSGAGEVVKDDTIKVLVLGSGPIRIGQGIEFDYCSVHAVWALKEAGYTAIIANNNPETVSTDFDTSDRLYFEPLTPEDVENIIDEEKPAYAIAQYGGQTAIKLTKTINDYGLRILGTQAVDVDRAEDRKKFDEVLEKLSIKRPEGRTVYTSEEAVVASNDLGYPVLVRPSYVLGGQGMEIAYSDGDVMEFMEIINRIEQEHPILVDKYLMGKEVEVDAVSDGEDILIPGIMEHVERAGVHSGDSISVYPHQTISDKNQKVLIEYTEKLSKELHIMGLVNIQYVIYNDEVYVIEVNPRSSRTVPYISKVTDIPMIHLAIQCMIGKKLKDLGYGTGLYRRSEYVCVKAPVFSFEKLHDVDTGLGPEMKSTGEVLGIAKDFTEALFKAITASGLIFPKRGGNVLMTVRDTDKSELVSIASRFDDLGYSLYATGNTAHYLNRQGIATNTVKKIGEGNPNILELLEKRKFDLVINTPNKGRKPSTDGFKIRRKAVEIQIPCLTSLDTANAVLDCLEKDLKLVDLEAIALQDMKRGTDDIQSR